MRAHFFDETFKINKDSGFMVAAGIITPTGVYNDITKPEIGLLKFYLKTWGGDGSGKIEFRELK